MTRRLAILVVVALLVAGAASLPAPLAQTATFPAVSPLQPARPGSDRSGVSYCPWAAAGDQRDTIVSLASTEPGSVGLSFPAGGEAGERTELDLGGPAATAFSLRNLLQRGDAPAVVEFSDGLSAAAALVRGRGLLSGDPCPDSIPKLWQLLGGSTREGERLVLRLFNPFPEDAKVTISAVSELPGLEAPAQFEALTVASRGWRDVEVAELLNLREQLAFTVTSGQGLVVPALMLQSGSHQAVWPGTGQSQVWEFPLVRAGGLRPVLALRNAGSRDVAVDVSLFTSDGPRPVAQEVVPGNREVRISLEGLGKGDFGVRLQAEGPVSAVLLGEGAQGRAATPGASRAARRWIAPGLGAKAPVRYDLWLLNSGTEPLTVTLRPLQAGGAAGPVDKVALPAGSVRSVQITQGAMAGLVAESLRPFSLAWSAMNDNDVAYLSGVPISE
ncbi:MAG: DUF5719 family protein [Actinomycetota bacterium]|nr:DUF5719 family protein [Actinomycetota bacterium]